MVVWARRTLAQHPDGIVEVAPAAVEALATMIGRTRDDLAAYLARFLPDLEQIPDQIRRSHRRLGQRRCTETVLSLRFRA